MNLRERGNKLARSIESILKDEIALQIRYASAVAEEGSVIRKFKTEQMGALAERRGMLADEIDLAQQKREMLRRSFPQPTDSKLTDLAKQYLHPEDAKTILQLSNKLRALVGDNKLRSTEGNRVAQFALNLIEGSLSILWSATQSVTKGYTRNARVKESMSPLTRDQSTLEEA